MTLLDGEAIKALIVEVAAELDDEVERTVAARHGLAADWLNDHAALWAPATLKVSECEALFTQGKLLVLGMPLRDVFLMKLNRGDPSDSIPMRSIWPLVSGEFASSAEVMAAYYARVLQSSASSATSGSCVSMESTPSRASTNRNSSARSSPNGQRCRTGVPRVLRW